MNIFTGTFIFTAASSSGWREGLLLMFHDMETRNYYFIKLLIGLKSYTLSYLFGLKICQGLSVASVAAGCFDLYIYYDHWQKK